MCGFITHLDYHLVSHGPPSTAPATSELTSPGTLNTEGYFSCTINLLYAFLKSLSLKTILQVNHKSLNYNVVHVKHLELKYVAIFFFYEVKSIFHFFGWRLHRAGGRSSLRMEKLNGFLRTAQ